MFFSKTKAQLAAIKTENEILQHQNRAYQLRLETQEKHFGVRYFNGPHNKPHYRKKRQDKPAE